MQCGYASLFYTYLIAGVCFSSTVYVNIIIGSVLALSITACIIINANAWQQFWKCSEWRKDVLDLEKSSNSKQADQNRYHNGFVNSLPVASNITVSTEKNNILNGILNGSDSNNDSLKYVLVNKPIHGSLVIADDGNYTYMPNNNFVGQDTFTYIVNDGIENSKIATVTINVKKPVLQSPIAYNQSLSMTKNGKISGFLYNSEIKTGNITYIIVKQPLKGKLTLMGNGKFIYIPNKNFIGVDTFNFIAINGDEKSNIATIIIKIK